MKKFCIILIALFMASDTMAQSAQPCSTCLPEGITFESQAQIDSFQVNYPNCTQIEGDVTINGDDIANLNGLSVLTSIGGYIYIYENESLSSLTGLENIIAGSITSFNIYNNILLSTCQVKSVCDYLSTPNGVIEIHDNATGCNSQEEVHLACTFGMDESYSSQNQFNIYPNPASTNITISAPATPDRNTFMTIYNINGQALLSRHITEQQTVVDASGLNAGIYFVRVISDDKVLVGKFVKQ